MVSKKQIIFILGMHRSGTSSIARLINLLGFDLGKSIMDPKTDNPKGFWENRLIVDSHDRILSLLGHRWDYVKAFPHDFESSKELDSEKLKLEQIVNQELGREKVAIKDPRLCLLLPIWKDICNENDWDPFFVLMLRHPSEVAMSLYKRDHTPFSLSILLWLRYVANSLYQSIGYPRIIVSYDEIMSDWRGVVNKIEGLGFTSLEQADSIAEAVEIFLSPSLRHHEVQDSHEQAELVAIAEYWYRRLIADQNKSELELIFKAYLMLVDYVDRGCCNSSTAERQTDDNRKRIYDEMNKSKVYASSLEVELERSLIQAASLHKNIGKKDVYIESLESILEEKNKIIDSYQGVFGEKDDYISSLETVLKEKDTIIDSQQQTLNEMKRCDTNSRKKMEKFIKKSFWSKK